MRRQRGVTLVELLTVVLVIGILAAIAVPSYTSYTRKAKRADAKVALTSTALQLDRCYTRYNDYSQLAACGVNLPYNTPNGTYTIDQDAAANPTPGITVSTYALKATPIGNQALDTHCGTFQLNQVNQKSVTTGATDCW
jgi:type IV pilus assembly protein PilE